MKLQLVLLALLALSASLASGDSVHFRGILNLGDARVFSVATEGGAQTAWVSVGDSFAGYEVLRFEEKENRLVLDKDGEELSITLAGAGTSASSSGTQDEASELLRSMKFEDMLSRSLEQQKEMMASMTRQMTEHMGMPVDEEAIALQMRVIDLFNEQMDWPSLQEDMARIYGETFTSDELRGLINFYSTPAGEAFIDKQPELMQGMMQIIQPRVMAVMPKMQQLMQEAAAEKINESRTAPAAGSGQP